MSRESNLHKFMEAVTRGYREGLQNLKAHSGFHSRELQSAYNMARHRGLEVRRKHGTDPSLWLLMTEFSDLVEDCRSKGVVSSLTFGKLDSVIDEEFGPDWCRNRDYA